MAGLLTAPLFWFFLVAQAVLLLHYFSRIVLHQTHPRAGLGTFIPFLLLQFTLTLVLVHRWDFRYGTFTHLPAAWRFLFVLSLLSGAAVAIFYAVWAMAGHGTAPAALVKSKRVPHTLKPPLSILERVGLHNQIYDLSVNEYEVFPPRWPKAWSGLRVAHVTDVHHGRVLHDGYLNPVRKALLRARPDLIAFTGDFVSTRRDIPNAFKWLAGLKAPLGLWAVLGNHEGWTDREAVERELVRARIRVLKYETAVFRRRGKTLVLMGADDFWTGEGKFENLRIKADARILLAHQPDHFFLGKGLKVDLQLSGHCHGGQICLPGGRALVAPSRFGARYASGFFQEGESIMFVSRGVGASPTLRFFCPPEVALLTVRAPLSRT